MRSENAERLGVAIADVIQESTREYHHRYLSSRQAAEYLGYTIQTIRKWRSENRGPRYIRMNNTRVRYDREELDRWMKSQEVANDA